jgi:hypothetical protein
MIEEAQRIVTAIRQMEASLDDSKSRRDYQAGDDELQITYPLTRCLQVLKEKHTQINRLHRERFEQVKSTAAPPPPAGKHERLTRLQNWSKDCTAAFGAKPIYPTYL